MHKSVYIDKSVDQIKVKLYNMNRKIHDPHSYIPLYTIFILLLLMLSWSFKQKRKVNFKQYK